MFSQWDKGRPSIYVDAILLTIISVNRWINEQKKGFGFHFWMAGHIYSTSMGRAKTGKLAALQSVSRIIIVVHFFLDFVVDSYTVENAYIYMCYMRLPVWSAIATERQINLPIKCPWWMDIIHKIHRWWMIHAKTKVKKIKSVLQHIWLCATWSDRVRSGHVVQSHM